MAEREPRARPAPPRPRARDSPGPGVAVSERAVDLDGAQVRQVERDDRRVAAAQTARRRRRRWFRRRRDDRDPLRRAGIEHAPRPRRRPAGSRTASGARSSRPVRSRTRSGVAAARRPAQAILGAVEHLAGGGADGVRERPRLGQRDLLERRRARRRRRRWLRRAPRGAPPPPPAAGRGAGRRVAPAPPLHAGGQLCPPPPSRPSRGRRAPRSRVRPIARRIIGEPSRERPRSVGGRGTSSRRSRRSAVAARSRCELASRSARRAFPRGLLPDVALALGRSHAVVVGTDPAPARGSPAPGSSCAPRGSPSLTFSTRACSRPPAGQVYGSVTRPRARSRAQRCGACG